MLYLQELDDAYYYCTHKKCLKPFGSEEEWVEHVKECHDGKVYVCFYCENAYARFAPSIYKISIF